MIALVSTAWKLESSRVWKLDMHQFSLLLKEASPSAGGELTWLQIFA
jgi:hypothetical protein